MSTTPILREKVLFKNDSPKEDLPFQFVGRRYQKLAARQLTAIWREETLTLNLFVIEQYKPAEFMTRTYWNGVNFRAPVGRLSGHENEMWYRNHTFRLVLSFKGDRPRLFTMKGKRIRDISYRNNEDAQIFMTVSADNGILRAVQMTLCDELRARYPEMPEHLTSWQDMLHWTRFQFARDVPVPVADIEPGKFSSTTSIKEVLDKFLGERTRRSTRRGLMKYANDQGYFRIHEMWSQATRLRDVAEAFDPSDWGDLVAGHINSVPVGMLEEFSLPRRRRLVTEPTRNHFDIHDSIRMWRQVRVDGVECDISDLATWNDIHRRLTDVTGDIHARRMIEQDEKLQRPVPQEQYKGIDGTTILDGGFTIVTPKGARDMMDWGSELSHCIGSYAISAIEERMFFFALVDNTNKEVTYTAMVDQKKMLQFRGKHNCIVPEDVTKAFVDTLIERELLDPGHPHSENWN